VELIDLNLTRVFCFRSGIGTYSLTNQWISGPMNITNSNLIQLLSSQNLLHNLTYMNEVNRKTSYKWIKGSWKVNITLNQFWMVVSSDNSLGMCHESWFCIKLVCISQISILIYYSFTQDLQLNLQTTFTLAAATTFTSITTFASLTLSPANYKGVSKFSNQESSFIPKT